MNFKVIQVHEHTALYIGQFYRTLDQHQVVFEQRYQDALLKYNDLHGNKYFLPLHNGICFKSYVGIIQVDDLIIEILPKIDHVNNVRWRDVLIDMLRETAHLRIDKVGYAAVDKQRIHLLDIYFDWYLNEVELLLHRGLIRKYYTETKNTLALKGKLEFASHIRKNIVHQERFYTTHQEYGKDHLFHQIIQEGLEIVTTLSRGSYRYGRCKTVQLNFPEVTSVRANAATFDRLTYSRKSEPYRTVMEIARLIILNYAPNVKSGSENMLALLFNMNNLWEAYVLKQLQGASKDVRICGQQSQSFWKSKTMRPDIVLKWKKGEVDITFIIDTKWKTYNYTTISSNDLRQIYVYSDYWNAIGGMLLYPNSLNQNAVVENENYHGRKYNAIIGQVSVLDRNRKLNTKLGEELLEMIFKIVTK